VEAIDVVEPVTLRTTVTRTEVFRAQGRSVLIADLDVGYLRLLQFGPAPPAPVETRKRRKSKHKDPPLHREMVIWWLAPTGQRVRLQGQLGWCSPLDSLATISLELPAAEGVTAGAVLEFEMRACGARAEPPNPGP
jgi:hypothetical protein